MKRQNLILQRGKDSFGINPEELERAQEICQDIELNSLDDWLSHLGKAEREIFKVLKENPDEVFTKEALGEQTKYSPEGGGFNNAISKLCTLGLAQKSDAGIGFNQDIREWLEA